MKRMSLRHAALLAAGLLLVTGCQKEKSAPAKKPDSSSASTTSADTKSAGMAINKSKSSKKSNEVSSDAITMAAFEGFLPSDPIESVELSEAEKRVVAANTKLRKLLSISSGTPAELDETEASDFQFEAPIRIKGGDKYIEVDSPGFACPTMADVDQDGKPDLVVGQYNDGMMRFLRNTASDSDSPEFATEAWIRTGDDIAKVPGIS